MRSAAARGDVADLARARKGASALRATVWSIVVEVGFVDGKIDVSFTSSERHRRLRHLEYKPLWLTSLGRSGLSRLCSYFTFLPNIDTASTTVSSVSESKLLVIPASAEGHRLFQHRYLRAFYITRCIRSHGRHAKP